MTEICASLEIGRSLSPLSIYCIEKLEMFTFDFK